jgi:hypothetical protein
MTRSIGISIVLFLCFSGLSAGQQSAVTGQVTDSEGAVIGNARVLVHWDSSGSTVRLKDNIGIKEDISVITDGSGHYSAAVPPGFYDVFVSATGFTPMATKVRVKVERPATFSPRLSADPIVTKELGDSFPVSKGQ